MAIHAWILGVECCRCVVWNFTFLDIKNHPPPPPNTLPPCRTASQVKAIERPTGWATVSCPFDLSLQKNPFSHTRRLYSHSCQGYLETARESCKHVVVRRGEGGGGCWRYLWGGGAGSPPGSRLKIRRLGQESRFADWARSRSSPPGSVYGTVLSRCAR